LYGEYAKQLAKHGRRFAETVTYAQDVSTALAATQSAVLRFKAAGVTHVYGASAFFLQAAESQNYRPRYAYLPGLGAIGAANSPAAQMRGAMTVGWAPSSDVNAPQDPPASPAGKHCTALMTRKGMSTSNRTDLTNMLTTCDSLYSLRDALEAGGVANVAGLRSGFESLGSGFPTALTFQVTMGPGRHHGVNAVRDMAYDTSCTCLIYTTRSNRT
jgi:ABC-type branched-subunit amino acid transport system substrate-binding protein